MGERHGPRDMASSAHSLRRISSSWIDRWVREQGETRKLYGSSCFYADIASLHRGSSQSPSITSSPPSPPPPFRAQSSPSHQMAKRKKRELPSSPTGKTTHRQPISCSTSSAPSEPCYGTLRPYTKYYAPIRSTSAARRGDASASRMSWFRHRKTRGWRWRELFKGE
jgi:hypothetical protein